MKSGVVETSPPRQPGYGVQSRRLSHDHRCGEPTSVPKENHGEPSWVVAFQPISQLRYDVAALFG